jgi:hypothetical protein
LYVTHERILNEVIYLIHQGVNIVSGSADVWEPLRIRIDEMNGQQMDVYWYWRVQLTTLHGLSFKLKILQQTSAQTRSLSAQVICQVPCNNFQRFNPRWPTTRNEDYNASRSTIQSTIPPGSLCKFTVMWSSTWR